MSAMADFSAVVDALNDGTISDVDQEYLRKIGYLPASPEEIAEHQMETDGAPPRRQRVALLQVYRASWTASIPQGGTWTELREATETEQVISASTDHGRFWLASGNGAPYYASFAQRVSDQLARVVYEYL